MSQPTLTSDPRPSFNRKVSSAEFVGQLKTLQGAHRPIEETVTVDGKEITIKNTGIVHTIPRENSIAVPSDVGLSVVATLFYNTRGETTVDGSGPVEAPARQDIYYGPYISEMAIFEFVQTIDNLIIPWKKWSAYHRSLDSAESPKVVDVAFSMPQELNLDELRHHLDLWHFERKWNVEVVLQPNNVFRRQKRLAVFDMDSTLIQQEVIDEIARFIGVQDRVSAITARAMNGELDFTASLRERVALLKGVPATVFESLKPVLTLTPGAKELCKALKRLGYTLAVLSGGFLPLANHIKEALGLDYAYANQLVVSEDGATLTGDLIGDIVNAERKAHLLRSIAKENNVPLDQVIAVGDGANDLKMMHAAGLGIAFDAKPTVQAEAPCRINTNNLQDVLYVLGFSKEEQTLLLKD